MQTKITIEKNTIPVVTPKFGIGSLFRVTMDSSSNDIAENSILVLGFNAFSEFYYMLDLSDGILIGEDEMGSLYGKNPNDQFTLREIEESFGVRLEYIKEIKVVV